MRLARNYEGYEIGCDKGTDDELREERSVIRRDAPHLEMMLERLLKWGRRELGI